MFMQENTEAVRWKMWEITKIFNKSGSDRILDPIYIARVCGKPEDTMIVVFILLLLRLTIALTEAE